MRPETQQMLPSLVPIRRYKMRQQEAVPVLTQFEAWLKENQLTALPDTAFGKAVNYCLRRWEELTRYTTAGFLIIDNNPVENALRPIAMGRKNWMFCATEEEVATLLQPSPALSTP